MRDPYNETKLCRRCGKPLYPDSEDSILTIAGWYHKSCADQEEAELEDWIWENRGGRD